MPRASGPGKRQQGASGQRDLKHDNGLVSPAKRFIAKKNAGHPDGSARVADSSAGHAEPSISPSLLPSNGRVNGGPSKNASDAALDNRSGDAARRGSVGECSETSSDSTQSHLGTNGGAVVEAGHRQIDVSALKNVDVHRDSGPLELAATVVKSLPMQDTLAILIILMHVPYMSLSVIYAIFALLTFVPPVTTRTGMNINLAEILDGSSHTPSLVTVMCMDFFFFIIWVFLWQPIQDGILEFAKPVIAITLGGGTNAKDGTSRGVTTCFTWILLHQAIRATKSHWSKFARHIPDSWPVPALLTESFDSRPYVYDKRNTHGWIQSTLAMHILTQGIVRYVREWYLKRERSNLASGLSDPEAGKASSAITGTTTGSAGTNTLHATDQPLDSNLTSTDADGGVSGSQVSTAISASAATAMSSTTTTTSKKRRKQSAQVRLQQPLWAALASTKIVAIKEYELSQWAPESKGEAAPDIHNLGSAPFDRQPRQIWISYVGSDEVCFNTSHFPDLDCETSSASSKANGHATRPSGVDTSKPFYVRINNAFWQPTRIFPIQESQDGEAQGSRWTGDIYGLRPASKYVCEFVDSRTDEVVFSTSIRTVKETLREHDPMSPNFSNSQQPLRPDSPATTLRTSIAAAEAKLAEERSRLKTWRKDWKSKINAVKKENELADNQLSSAGNSDEKHRQKIRQQETQKAQAERDTELLSEQLKNFDTAPELADRKKKAERLFSAEKKIFDAAQKEFKDYNATLDAEVKSKELEKSNLNTRRNKIETRIAKVDTELSNIADANNRGLGEVERRQQERAVWEKNARAIENNYNERLVQICNGNASRAEYTRALQAQLQGFNPYMNPANGGLPMDAGSSNLGDLSVLPAFRQQPPWNPNPAAAPHYPAGMWTGSSSDLLPPGTGASGHPSIAAWQAPSGFPIEARVTKSRGRSSSMLSDVSGFTEPSDDGSFRSPPFGFQRPVPPHAGKNGTSGSSDSSGSGSVGDPSSPR